MKKNPFEMFENKEIKNDSIKEIDKGIIFDKLNTQAQPFLKTGEQIIDQIKNIVVPNLKAIYDEKVAEVEKLIPQVGELPTKEYSEVCGCSIIVAMPYKYYNYDETYLHQVHNDMTNEDESTDSDDSSLFANFAEEIGEEIEKKDKPNYPETQEQASARSEYNKWVSRIYNILLDVKTCNILINNLDKSATYSLNLGQMAALCFE